jgi:2-amino-4-hydroxy-6-hydroxymethyldihydropteridine diphosphokinase
VRAAYFSLGSNMGDRAAHLRDGVQSVAGDDAHRVSRVYETEPVGGVVQEDFWNLVLEVTTDATLLELLERCRVAEARRDRTREVRWGPRTLDVDVLLVGNELSDDPAITIPHPRMWERAFVLAPLAELAPQLVDEARLATLSERVRVLGTLESLH